jgi:hypothetical protein
VASIRGSVQRDTSWTLSPAEFVAHHRHGKSVGLALSFGQADDSLAWVGDLSGGEAETMRALRRGPFWLNVAFAITDTVSVLRISYPVTLPGVFRLEAKP